MPTATDKESALREALESLGDTPHGIAAKLAGAGLPAWKPLTPLGVLVARYLESLGWRNAKVGSTLAWAYSKSSLAIRISIRDLKNAEAYEAFIVRFYARNWPELCAPEAK